MGFDVSGGLFSISFLWCAFYLNIQENLFNSDCIMVLCMARLVRMVLAYRVIC